VIFDSCKANTRVYDAKSALIPPPPAAAASPKRLLKFAFATQPVWARTPDSQPSKVYPPSKLVLCHSGLSTGKISQGPQPDFKIVSESIFPC
jgi:hypothetical protein